MGPTTVFPLPIKNKKKVQLFKLLNLVENVSLENDTKKR